MNMTDRPYPIRIAQIIGEAPNGGVESVIRNYYQHIDRTKFQFDFYVNNTSDIIRKDKIEEMGGRIFIIPPYKKNLYVFEKYLYKKFKEEKYVIVHSNMNTISYFVLRAAKKAGVPIRIAHSHSTSNPNEKMRNMIKNVLKRKSCVYPTNYVACSESAGRWLFGEDNFTEKGVVIPNGIDIEKFKFSIEERNEVRKAYHIADSTTLIGHVGRLVKQKNQQFLISVFADYKKINPDSVLMILGEGPLKEILLKQIQELNLENSVFFVGSHKHPERFYSAFDVFMLPSLYEGLGMVLIEAQISGLPCIMSSEIPMEAKILDSCIRLPIDLKEKWVKALIGLNQASSNIRNLAYECFLGKEFDIIADSHILEDYYNNLIAYTENKQ